MNNQRMPKAIKNFEKLWMLFYNLNLVYLGLFFVLNIIYFNDYSIEFYYFHLIRNLAAIDLIPNLFKRFVILDSFKYTGITNTQNLSFVGIADNLTIGLAEGLILQALEMEHKVPCWSYSLKDCNRKLVFTTDTRKNDNTIKLARNADVLIHEATFKHRHRDKAWAHFHSTEIQAMEIADASQVKRLILTHFSQRLKDEDVKKWTWQGQPCVVFDERQKI